MSSNYNPVNACTFRGGAWIAGVTNYVRQGYWAEGGNYQNIGVIVFDNAALKALFVNYYPVSATLTLTRLAAGGYGSDGTMTLYAGSCSGMPAIGNNVNVSGTAPGMVTGAYYRVVPAGTGVKSLDLDPALISSLASGAANCLFMQTTSTYASDYMAFTGRDDLTKITLTITWATRTTASGAPTSCSVNTTLSEGGVTLSWSGAVGGTNNAIASYEIQYSDSADNSLWSAWTALSAVTTTLASGSVNVSPPDTRGYYRRFRIRTRGAAGESYYSGWRVSSNSVRKNLLPSAPAVFSAAPTIYGDEAITLSWSGVVAGTSAISQYRISSQTSMDDKAWSEWELLTTLSLNATGGTYAPTVSRVSGTYTRFKLTVIDALMAESEDKLSGSIRCDITAAGAPTAVMLSAALAEANVTLSWSGALGGAGNAITSYEIQYSDSADGNVWGEWTALTILSTGATSGGVSVAAPNTRGYYRRFRVRARGTAGAAYYSGFTQSTGSVRKNLPPSPPTSLTALPEVYDLATITLTWEGVLAGTSAIKEHTLWRRVATDGVSYGSWAVVATIASPALSGSYSDTPSVIPRSRTQYALSVTDTLGAVSALTYSNTIRRNAPPTVPTVASPVAGAVTYNPRPRILITTGTEPDGASQALDVRLDSGAWLGSDTNGEYFSPPGWLGDNIKTVFTPEALSVGRHTVQIRARDSDLGSASATVARAFTVEAPPFEDIKPNATRVKASHILTLRVAVNNLRAYYGLPLFPWPDDVIPGRTAVRDWPLHILRLREAIEQLVPVVNAYGMDIPVSWLPLGHGRPRADVMNQLRDVVILL